MVENKDNTFADKIFIGTGGSNPGIDMLDIETTMAERVLTLPAGDSVYAVDVNRDHDILVAGTKGGYFHWLTSGSDKGVAFCGDKFIQGSPILSVCHLDQYRIAASDIQGRCLIWDIDRMKKPEKLHMGGRIICALFKPTDGRLAGISMKGKLLIWDTSTLEQVNVLDIPHVPPLSALVQPVYWAGNGCWIWPGSKGQIVRYDPGTGKINAMAAHDEDFYGMTVCQGKLLTAGRYDGILKVWQAKEEKPVKVFDVSQGIISAVAWPASDCWHILLSSETGTSELYQYQQDGLVFSHNVAIRNCRTIVGVDAQKIISTKQARIIKEIEDICLGIQENIYRQRFGQSDIPHEKLKALGCGNASLSLQGREAQAKGDLISELEAYSRLFVNVKHESNFKFSFFERYAQILEKFWLTEQALSVYSMMKEPAYEADRNARNITRLKSVLDVLSRDRFVIEPDITLNLVIQASSLLNSPVNGRYVLKNHRSSHIKTSVSSGDFIECFNKPKNARWQISDPELFEQVHWLLRTGCQSDDVVIFSNDDAELKHLELCVRFIDNGPTTIINTAFLFNAGKLPLKMSAEQHNRQLMEGLELIQKSPNAIGLMRTTSSIVDYAIRQLITGGKAKMRALLRS